MTSDIKTILEAMEKDPALAIFKNSITPSDPLAFAESPQVKEAMDVLEKYTTKLIEAWEKTGPECLKTELFKQCTTAPGDREKAALIFFIQLYNAIGSKGLPAVMKLHDDIVIAMNRCFAKYNIPEITVKLRANSDINLTEEQKKKRRAKEHFENFTNSGVTPLMLGCDETVVDCGVNLWHVGGALLVGLLIGIFIGIFIGKKTCTQP